MVVRRGRRYCAFAGREPRKPGPEVGTRGRLPYWVPAEGQPRTFHVHVFENGKRVMAESFKTWDLALEFAIGPQ